MRLLGPRCVCSGSPLPAPRTLARSLDPASGLGAKKQRQPEAASAMLSPITKQSDARTAASPPRRSSARHSHSRDGHTELQGGPVQPVSLRPREEERPARRPGGGAIKVFARKRDKVVEEKAGAGGCLFTSSDCSDKPWGMKVASTGQPKLLERAHPAAKRPSREGPSDAQPAGAGKNVIPQPPPLAFAPPPPDSGGRWPFSARERCAPGIQARPSASAPTRQLPLSARGTREALRSREVPSSGVEYGGLWQKCAPTPISNPMSTQGVPSGGLQGEGGGRSLQAGNWQNIHGRNFVAPVHSVACGRAAVSISGAGRDKPAAARRATLPALGVEGCGGREEAGAEPALLSPAKRQRLRSCAPGM